ncbi:type II toxin-antitoxin system death-on-curing family toxin [Streptomyces alkaliterrae]|uniref:Type II toxin-antitoxin system death-on-curing family toxin n=1 Tax=Streptomyces alkaliterrae TaxID=2213162 RepID=A0A5P0YXY4_9ACTN|nr:type II toxin-antitoxin system death-on-curing family toxin [Streptomyces alkaliterrae]MBB1256766.1 type II toxin-antitoxin system death-on-curing family toxin [Streptomyces alkaliterrae]MBB1261407.1 type II toxin-antitoxin system death-on-curing family toxin [Streptomyces alkaliterrae]MQS05144.1 type II toxin-antitoxin system death-on-curing family toxin [Streptomyces alkaliterrae]
MSVVHLVPEDGPVIAGYACEGGPVEIRDRGLLTSALRRPETTAFGEELFPDVFDKAAALLHGIAVNHPLVDGNKRTAFLACVTLLRLNGVRLRPDVDEAEDLVVGVASGRIREVPEIAGRLRALGVGAE